MKKYKNTIFWIIILSIAFFFRFYKLGEVPNGLYVDEAAIGYNSYSILNTGKDEFGKCFPVVFRSFSDFKTPVYIYLSAPFIKLFGLNPFSVRFLSALLSFLTIPLSFLLINKLLSFEEDNRYELLKFILPTVLAISPWHINFGRAAFETNISLFLLLLSTYFFYLSLKKPRLFFLSSLLFVLTFASYHAERLIVPVLLMILAIRHKKRILKYKKYVIFSLIFGVIMLLPTLKIMFSPGFLARAGGLNILNYQKHTPAGYVKNLSGFPEKIINNKFVLSSKEFLALYISYFSPRNLFIVGDSDLKVAYPSLSTFFVWQFPFYFLGLYVLVRKLLKSEFGFLTLTMLLVFPIPAALTNDPFTTIRSLPLVFPLTILVSVGIVFFWKSMHSKFLNLNYLFLIASVITLIYSVLKLYSSIFILNNYYRERYWNYGFEELSQKIEKLDQHLPVVFDNVRLGPAYAEFLFFQMFDPITYQQQNSLNLNNYYSNTENDNNKHFGNIETRGIDWKNDTRTEKYLIGDNLAISEEQITKNKLTVLDRVYYSDGSLAFTIVKTNP